MLSIIDIKELWCYEENVCKYSNNETLLGNVQGKVCFVTLHQYQLQYVIEMKCQYWQNKKNKNSGSVFHKGSVWIQTAW
jgi:hypothetical protein